MDIVEKLPTVKRLMRQLQKVPFLASKNMYRVMAHFLKMDKDQLDQFCRVLHDIKTNVVFCRHCYVWQEKADETRGEKITEMINSFEESGYCTSRWDLDNGFIPSYADKKYYNAINYNGNVLKCTANDDLQHNNPPGKLENDGNIAWEDGVLDKI